MEFKGTKTNWRVRGDYKALEVFSSYGSICAIARQSSIDSDLDSEGEANSKLIACALEMLEIIEKIYTQGSLHQGDYSKLEQLIKKATE